MVKLSMTVGSNTFQIETDAPLSEVRPILDQWFAAIAGPPPVLHGTLVFDPPVDQPLPSKKDS